MNYPRTTHLNQRQMTSRPRFLTDGQGIVYVNCYFSQLSSTYSVLLGPLKPTPQATDRAFRP